MSYLSPEHTAELFDATRIYAELEWSFIASLVPQAVLIRFVDHVTKFRNGEVTAFHPSLYEPVINKGEMFRQRANELLGTVDEYSMLSADAYNAHLDRGEYWDETGVVSLHAQLIGSVALLSKTSRRIDMATFSPDNHELPVTDEDVLTLIDFTDRLEDVNSVLAVSLATKD